MGWFVTAFAALMFAMGISAGSPLGVILSIILAGLTMPPVWQAVKSRGHNTFAGARWSGALVIGFAAMAVNGAAYSDTPAGQAAEARREARRKAEADKIVAKEATKKAAEDTEKQKRIASGEHCLSSWDGSFPALKDAVKRQLRNPRSFEHVETVRSPVDAQGMFGLIMTYRAENGFGGMNVEAIGVEVAAETCRFKRASDASLARRLRAGR